MSSWSRGSVPSSHARGQQFEPRRRQYFKLLLDPGDFHSNPSRLLSFSKSETVLWTLAKIYYIIILPFPSISYYFHIPKIFLNFFLLLSKALFQTYWSTGIRWGWRENLLGQAVVSGLEPLTHGMGTWNAASRPAWPNAFYLRFDLCRWNSPWS